MYWLGSTEEQAESRHTTAIAFPELYTVFVRPYSFPTWMYLIIFGAQSHLNLIDAGAGFMLAYPQGGFQQQTKRVFGHGERLG
jgi:hypothetical protein